MEHADTYAHSAAWYDTIYAGQGKDYVAEAQVVARIVRDRAPGAGSLLDVGCGTGMHLAAFAEQFEVALGVDVTPQFVEHCRARGLDAIEGDMRDLRPGRSFDVVASMFSAIAHVRDVDELDRAVASMASCLAPGGVLVVEPWFAPAQWEVGHHGVEVVDGDDEILVRTNHSGLDGDRSVLHFAWTHVDPSGITRMDEQLHLLLVEPERYRIAFERAGLQDIAFDAAGCNADGRGLWIASRGG